MTHDRMTRALARPDASVRLRAALAAGTEPEDGFIGALVERCAVEPDFYVRDMLTWALTRHDATQVVPRLLLELESDRSQARSQALHTLSKIGDGDAWSGITPDLLHSAEGGVARAAWRAAVVLAPAGSRTWLAAELAKELGRGGSERHLSLSRAIVALDEAGMAAVSDIGPEASADVRAHARATEMLGRDPDAGFALDEARRVANLGPLGAEQ